MALGTHASLNIWSYVIEWLIFTQREYQIYSVLQIATYRSSNQCVQNVRRKNCVESFVFSTLYGESHIHLFASLHVLAFSLILSLPYCHCLPNNGSWFISADIASYTTYILWLYTSANVGCYNTIELNFRQYSEESRVVEFLYRLFVIGWLFVLSLVDNFFIWVDYLYDVCWKNIVTTV